MTFCATLTGNEASNRLNITIFVISRSISVEIDTSLALFKKLYFYVFCMFSFATLSRSQFCFDCLQNLTKDRKLSSAVCYFKSARSVCNFRHFRGPRLRKKTTIKMSAKNTFVKKKRQVRCLFPLILTCWSRTLWYLDENIRPTRKKWRNYQNKMSQFIKMSFYWIHVYWHRIERSCFKQFNFLWPHVTRKFTFPFTGGGVLTWMTKFRRRTIEPVFSDPNNPNTFSQWNDWM